MADPDPPLQISSPSSRTYLPSTTSSFTSFAPSSLDFTPALISSHWLRDVIVLAQADFHHHNLLDVKDASCRQSLGEINLEELRQHPVCVLDVTWEAEFGFDGYEQHYKQAHIPGATFLNLQTLSPPRADGHQECPIPDPDHFQRYVSTLGVKTNTHVITYDSLDTRSAARAWFLFRLFGHDRVSVLDGGLKQWRRDGFEICTGGSHGNLNCLAETSAQDHRAHNLEKEFKAMLRPELLRNFSEMKSIVENGEAQVIDSRPSDGAFYLEDKSAGASGLGTSARAQQLSAPGHMPGAINLPFSSLFTAKGTFKEDVDLLHLFKVTGVDLSVPAVATSQRGTSSCSVALAAFLLGAHEMPIYNGSWAEWQVLAPQSLIVVTQNS